MKDTEKLAQSDVAEEAFRGPAPHVAALGQGMIDHLTWAIVGLVSGSLVAAIFHKPTLKVLESSRAALNAGAEHASPFISIPAKIVRKLTGKGELHPAITEKLKELPERDTDHFHHLANEHKNGFGLWFFNHILALIPPLKRWVGELTSDPTSRVATSITAGGALGLIGYIGGWVNAAVHGGSHASAGRKQFERAQAEILDQRAINEALLEKIRGSQARTGGPQTNQAIATGTLYVAKDEAPPVAQAPIDATPSPTAIETVRPASETPPTVHTKDTVTHPAPTTHAQRATEATAQEPHAKTDWQAKVTTTQKTTVPELA